MNNISLKELEVPESSAAENVVLLARGISKSFPGGVVALDNVTLDMRVGEVLALLGENGSGKSTFVKILYGVYTADAGEIYLRAGDRLERVNIGSPADAMKLGIMMVSQVPQLVGKLTIAENLALTLKSLKLHGVKSITSISKISKIIAEESERVGIKVDPNERVYNLTYTQKQLVEILKAMIIGARVLLLDEALTYLPHLERKKLYQALMKLKEEGRSIVVITHKIPEAMEVSDRIAVLRAGRLVGVVNTREISIDQVRAMMFGQEKAKQISYSRIQIENKPGEPVIVVKDLYVEDDYGREAVKGVDLSVRAGEVVGVAGIAGNGQRELVEAIVGLREIKSGDIILAGVSVKRGGIKLVRDIGIGVIPDRLIEFGVSIENSILDNIAACIARNGLIVKWDLVRKLAASFINEYQIVTPSPEASVKYLSGGNILKCIVSKELEVARKAIVAHNPTRVLDEASAIYVRRKIKEKAAKEGVAVLLVSEDLDEVLMTSDTIFVMSSGKLYGPFSPDTPREEIEKYMVM